MVQMAAGRLLVETVAAVVVVVVVSHPSSYMEIAVGEFLAAEIRYIKWYANFKTSIECQVTHP